MQTNTVSLPKLDPHQIRWFSNKVWQWQPHLRFFENCLVEHLRKTGTYKRKTGPEIEVNKALYRKLLLDGKEVTINNCRFKLIQQETSK